MSNALIVFVKNPVLCKVKTRLAKTIGDEKALLIYQKLLQHTQAVCKKVNATRYIFYSDFINENDGWNGYEKRLQCSGDLGDKMLDAFREIARAGSTKMIVIGSDCVDINPTIINEAFDMLDAHAVVVGPANDGGYYLLGMKEVHPFLFENKSWSTNKVLQQTLADLLEKNLSYFLLPVLNDIDEEKDLAGTQLLEE